MTLEKLLCFCQCQFSHLYDGDSSSTQDGLRSDGSHDVMKVQHGAGAQRRECRESHLSVTHETEVQGSRACDSTRGTRVSCGVQGLEYPCAQ